MRCAGCDLTPIQALSPSYSYMPRHVTPGQPRSPSNTQNPAAYRAVTLAYRKAHRMERMEGVRAICDCGDQELSGPPTEGLKSGPGCMKTYTDEKSLESFS